MFFSLPKPSKTIAPHYGQSNHALTVHLSLDAYPGSFLKVKDTMKEWSENDILIFDDCFLHSAQNNSEKTRSVLIFSIWHPDLNYDERLAIQHVFKSRQTWLNNRFKSIEALIGRKINQT